MDIINNCIIQQQILPSLVLIAWILLDNFNSGTLLRCIKAIIFLDSYGILDNNYDVTMWVILNCHRSNRGAWSENIDYHHVELILIIPTHARDPFINQYCCDDHRQSFYILLVKIQHSIHFSFISLLTCLCSCSVILHDAL